MVKLPRLSGKDVIKILSKLGFKHIRTRGSHAILTKTDLKTGKVTIPVPIHKELAKGTLKNIMKRSDLSLEKLVEMS